jgi:phospholipid N-methyltransferase
MKLSDGLLQPDRRIAFFKGFLKRPAEVGSLIPSSRFLERRIVDLANAKSAQAVVELGPGTGGTTRALLRSMPLDAVLLTIEINPRFHNIISAIRDPRLIAHRGCAGDIVEIVSSYEIDPVDAVVSGIPFSIIKPEFGRSIIQSISDLLTPDGRFVAYQFRDRVNSLGREVLGPGRVQLELLNIPPVRVYSWTKNGHLRLD